MNTISQNLLMDWDKETDMVYAVLEGYNTGSLVNIDSEKVPGMVKRMDPRSRMCVGFIIHNFSELFPREARMDEDHVRWLISWSLTMTNEPNLLAQTA